MKKLTALLLAIFAVICIFSSCAGQKAESSRDRTESSRPGGTQEISVSAKLKKFYAYLADNAYTDAAAEYKANILGNAKLEAEAEECITEYLKQIDTGVLSGRYDKTSAAAMLKTVENLCDEADIVIVDYSELRGSIEASLESKVAYKSGVSLFESGNYTDAIAELSKVLPNDPDYADAQARIKTAGESYAADIAAKAKSYADDKEYLKAVSLLKEAVKVLPENADLAADLNTYEMQYKSYVIESAEEVFDDYTKYAEAAKIIQAGLQQYPDDTAFAEKRDYYNSFAPVKVGTLTLFENEDAVIDDYEEDTKGGRHQDVVSVNGWFADKCYVVYILDGKYNKLTFTVFGTSAGSTGFGGISLRDYSDGDYDKSTVIYIDEEIKNGALPYEVEVDVTGVQMVRVWLSNSIAFADAVVQRTVK